MQFLTRKVFCCKAFPSADNKEFLIFIYGNVTAYGLENVNDGIVSLCAAYIDVVNCDFAVCNEARHEGESNCLPVAWNCSVKGLEVYRTVNFNVLEVIADPAVYANLFKPLLCHCKVWSFLWIAQFNFKGSVHSDGRHHEA